MKKYNVSSAQKEVWRWKEDYYKDVAHLSTITAVNKRIHDASDTIRKLGLYTVDATIPSHRCVADEPASYGKD